MVVSIALAVTLGAHVKIAMCLEKGRGLVGHGVKLELNVLDTGDESQGAGRDFVGGAIDKLAALLSCCGCAAPCDLANCHGIATECDTTFKAEVAFNLAKVHAGGMIKVIVASGAGWKRGWPGLGCSWHGQPSSVSLAASRIRLQISALCC